MEEPIQIKDYVKKTDVAKKLRDRVKQELFYSYIGIAGPVATYGFIIIGGVWGGIIPIGLISVILYLRIRKLQLAEKYIKENYDSKLKEKETEFI
jgi:hypothetical protein